MKKTVLIVEDNPEERKIFSTYFQFVGGRVVEAANGEQGLAAAQEYRPDLILMDLSMPVMNGWEAVRRLQSDSRLSRIPVIAITAHHLSVDRLEEAGFCGYLEKPLAPYRVLSEVERCLGPLATTPGGKSPRQLSGTSSEESDRRQRFGSDGAE
jgi:two-component system, cell cycle response regulator DivK